MICITHTRRVEVVDNICNIENRWPHCPFTMISNHLEIDIIYHIINIIIRYSALELVLPISLIIIIYRADWAKIKIPITDISEAYITKIYFTHSNLSKVLQVIISHYLAKVQFSLFKYYLVQFCELSKTLSAAVGSFKLKIDTDGMDWSTRWSCTWREIVLSTTHQIWK